MTEKNSYSKGNVHGMDHKLCVYVRECVEFGFYVRVYEVDLFFLPLQERFYSIRVL